MEAKESFTLAWCGVHENWYQYNCPDCMIDANKEEIRREGRREVVEYLDKHTGAMIRLVSNGGETIKTTFEIDSSDWLAKLKEWGLKEDGTSD